MLRVESSDELERVEYHLRAKHDEPERQQGRDVKMSDADEFGTLWAQCDSHFHPSNPNFLTNPAPDAGPFLFERQ